MSQSKEKLLQANKLKNEIDELDHFLEVVVEYVPQTMLSTMVFLEVKRSTQFSLFGTRYIGAGSREQQIKIPNSIRNDVRRLVQTHRDRLQKDLDNLFSNVNEERK